MKTSVLLAPSVLLAGLGAVTLVADGPAAAQPAAAQPAAQPDVQVGVTRPIGATLPGAREAIDAATYPSLQAALDAVPEAGGVVRLPPGEFHINQPLRITRGDVHLVGAGASTHIVNDNEEGEPALVVAHPKGADVTGSEKLWRVSLADFRLTGNPDSGHGVHAVQINEFFVQGVTVSRHGGDGLRLDPCYEDPRVSDCLITYNAGAGLRLVGCHDIVVSANHFEENDDALVCVDGYNLCMTGNNLDDHLGRGVVIENTYGSVVSGNMIEECAAAAVTLDRDCYGIAISANVIAHNGSGVDLIDAHGCAVSANAFTILKTDAVRVGPDSGRITIAGNNFANSFVGDGKLIRVEGDLAAAGLALESAHDSVVTGNLFSGLTTPAIDVRGEEPQNVLQEGNLIVE